MTEGAVEALYNVCRARVQAGHDVRHHRSGLEMADAVRAPAGAEVIEIPIYEPANNYRLTAAQLKAAVDERTRIIYLVDPNNPLGICYSREEIEAFAAIARDCRRASRARLHLSRFRRRPYPGAAFCPEGAVVIDQLLEMAGPRRTCASARSSRQPGSVRTAGRSADRTMLGRKRRLAARGASPGSKSRANGSREINAAAAANKAEIIEAASADAGLALPIYPSHGNFLVLETHRCRHHARSAVSNAIARQGIMIRQGTYHTQRFGHRFVKVSTSVPSPWAEKFCTLLPEMIAQARTLNDLPPLF